MKETDGQGRLKDAHGDVHYHNHFTVNFPEVALINAKLEVLDRKQDIIMGALDDLRAKVAAGFTKVDENATVTAEIASDMKDLVDKLANGAPGSQEVIDATAEANALLDKLTAQNEALKAIAAQHTP